MDGEKDAEAALERYRLHGIEETGKELGRGSYAAVVEVNYKGLRCAGKKIHRVLYEQEVGDLVTRFEEECRLLGHLRHPHVVQFIGIYFEPDTNLPVLVMEFLPTTLAQCLDQYGVLPEEINYSILQDVALALRYLHERPQPIVHRDLSANNVLLTSDMRAKISDLGVAKIFNLSPAQMSRMTRGPGTPSYMPPEALIPNPRYDVKVDIFSYGVMIVHVLSGQWPLPGEPNRVNPNHPTGLTPVSEADRREEYLNVIGRNHPLMELIQRCLSNSPIHRPEAEAVLQRVNEVSSRFPASFANKIEMMKGYQARAEYESKQLNKDKKDSDRQNLAHSMEVEQLHLEVANLKGEVVSLSETLQTKEKMYQAQIVTRDAKISAKDAIISAKDAIISAKDSQISLQVHEMSASDAEMSAVHQELASKSLLLSKKDEIVHGLNEQLSSYRKHLTSATESHLLFPEGKLVWRECADIQIPFAAAESSQVVVLNHMVYIGNVSVTKHSQVFKYDPIENTWSTLPPTPVKCFGIGQLSGKLLLVGGLIPEGWGSWFKGTEERTAYIHVFDTVSQTWRISEIPPMPTARSSSSVISHSSALIVCGGTGQSWSDLLTTVEVYKAEPGQWYRCTISLPSPCSSMSSVTIGDTSYLYHKSHNCTYYASASQLLDSGVQPGSKEEVWQVLNMPFSASTIASFAGCLVALNCKSRTRSGYDLCAYRTCTSSWLYIGDLPLERTYSTAVLLPSKDLLVISLGGIVLKGAVEL